MVAEGVGLCRDLRGAAMLAAVQAARGPTAASQHEYAFLVFRRRLSTEWNISSHREHPPTTRVGLRRNLHRACTLSPADLQRASLNRSARLLDPLPAIVVHRQRVRRGGTPVRAHADGLPLKVTLIHELSSADRRSPDPVAADSRARDQDLFREARAIVAVSNAMHQRLISLGAPSGRVHCNPCGVDCGLFSSASPATAAAVFVSHTASPSAGISTYL